MWRITCQGSNCRIKVRLLFSLILGFPPNLFSPCPVAPSLLTFLTALPLSSKGETDIRRNFWKHFLKKPLRAAVGTRQFKPRQRRVSCGCRRGLRIVLIPVRAFFSVLCYFPGLYSSKRWVAFGHPAHLPRAECAVQPQFQICFKHHGMDKDLCNFFILYFRHELVNFQVMNIQFVQIWQSDA